MAGSLQGGRDQLGMDEIDTSTQRAFSHHLSIVDGRLKRLSMPSWYAWPSELDLMAQILEMRLREWWGGWSREPFMGESTMRVPVSVPDPDAASVV
jgi:hypothetical protein